MAVNFVGVCVDVCVVLFVMVGYGYYVGICGGGFFWNGVYLARYCCFESGLCWKYMYVVCYGICWSFGGLVYM